MDQVQKTGGRGSRWDNPFPSGSNRQSQSASGTAADCNTSNQSHYLKPSHLNLLANFGLSGEDLEELSHYPDDQLTPENMPLLLQAIQKRKLALKVPTVPLKIREKVTASSGGGHRPIVKKVIDYGHKSKYERSEDPVEVSASSTVTDESMKGFQTQQPVPAAPSSLISNPKNPTKELTQQVGSQTSTPNLQASPPVAKKVPSAEPEVPATAPPEITPAVTPTPQSVVPPVAPSIVTPAVTQRPLPFAPELVEILNRQGSYEHTSRADPPNRSYLTTDGQKSFWKEAEEPIKSPFGVVKASWLPVFSQIEKQKAKKLPTPSQISDYCAVPPRKFPHICSLCNEDCKDKTDWIQHQNTLLHSSLCRWLLQQYPDWTPETPSSPQRHEDDRQERHKSRQRSASPSPKRSRRSSSGHSRRRTRSRSKSCGRRTRSRSKSCGRRTRSRSRSCGRWTRSQSRSCGRTRTSRQRSRSPRRFPSPRRRSRSPRQSLHSSGRSRSSSSKERGSGSSTRSPERRRTKTPPRNRYNERKWTYSISDGWRWEREDLGRTREDTPRQKLSVNETRIRKQKHDKLVPERRSREEPECSALASLTEKSIIQAMAQLHAPGVADTTLSQGRNSAQPAARGANASAMSSNLVSMIQQVATQVITAVLDSKEASATQASTRVRDANPQKVNSVTRKAKSQSVIHPTLQSRTSASHEASPKSVVDLSSLQGTAKSRKAKRKSLESPCPKRGASLSSKAKNRHVEGQSPPKSTSSSGKTKNKLKAGLCPKKSTSLCSKEKKEHVESPCVQPGSAASAKEENQHAVDQRPEQGIASSNKAANDGMVGLSPHQGTVAGSKAEDHGVAGACPQQGTESPCIQQGSPGSAKKENQRAVDQRPKQGIASSDKAANDGMVRLSPHQGTAVNSKSENQGVAGACPQQGVQNPCVQQGSAASAKEENQHVIDQPEQGIASSNKAANDGMVGLSPHQGTAAGGKAEDQGVAGACPQQGTAVSGKSENRGVASCSLSEGTAGNSKAESLHVAHPVFSQGTAARGKTQNKCLAVPSSQQGIGPNSKAGSQGPELKLVPGSICPPSGTPGQVAKPRVCIYGDSLVVSAQKRASSTTAGSQLGLEELVVLEWHGRENMAWIELVPIIAAQGQTPDVVLVHLGGYDSAYTMGLELHNTVVKALFLLKGLFPQIKVILSEIIPHGIWHGIKKMRPRVELNAAVRETVRYCGGAVIRHHRIASQNRGLFTDQMNLSDAGLDIFLEDIKNGILAQVSQSSRAVSGGFKEGMRLPPPASPAVPTGLGSTSQKVATREDEVASPSKEAPGMQTASGEAAVSSVSSKAETSALASPSPQPGTSGTSKVKNQDMEQKLVIRSIPPCPETCEPAAKPRVWICGDSLVVSAQKWDLQKRKFGQLDWLHQSTVLEWHGQEDLTWAQLVPMVQKLAAQGQAPDVLVVHLGGKDFLSTPWPELSSLIKKEVASLKEVFPKVRLMWSEMLPQNICPAEGGACKAGRGLQEVNLALGELISSFGGVVIKHPASSSFPMLNVDGGGLSQLGLDIFLEDINNGVHAHVLQSSGADRGGLKEGKNLPQFTPLDASAGLVSMKQEVAIQGDQAGPSSEEASQTQRNTGGAAVSSQPAFFASHGKKTQTVGRKSLCENFSFRLGDTSPHKLPENQGQFLFGKSWDGLFRTAVKESFGQCSRSPGHSSKPRVWICGDSLVVSAQKHASSMAAGSQLGLEQTIILEWHGQENLKWIQLLPFLQHLVTWCQAPDVLIIHLGEKALARAMDQNLVDRVESEWFLLRTLFPQVRVIWSEIIPQGVWRGEEERCRRKKMNIAMGWHVGNHKGDVIEHPRISSEDPQLYNDDTNLSHAGLDIFLEDIRNGILAHVLQSSRAAGGGFKEGMSLPPPASPAAPTGLAAVRQEIAAREGELVLSSQGASRMQTSTGEAAVSSQPASSKAENLSVASPGPQPGATGTCKAKKQEAGQKLVVGSIPLCSESARRLSKPRVWICGNSLVAAARERAATRTGCQLGLEKKIVLEWHGQDGMMWVHLIPFLQDLATYCWPPDVLIIHLGESDLIYTLYYRFLIKIIQRELFLVKELFPNVKVVWSDMIPWVSWPELPSTAFESLEEVNLDVGLSVQAQGGAVIKHPGISSEHPKIVEGKLSRACLDVFLRDIKKGICFYLYNSSQAVGGGLNRGTRIPSPAAPMTPAGLASVSQEVATLDDDVVSFSKKASSMQMSTGEAAVNSQLVSSGAETSGVASPSPQPGTSGTFMAENQDVKQKPVLGSIPPGPEGAAVSSQPVSIKAEDSSMASPGLQLATSGPCKAEKKDVAQKPLLGNVPPCPREAAVSSQPVNIKAEDSGVASPSPQLATSGRRRAKKKDVARKPLLENVPPCPGGAAVSSQPASIKAEDSGVATPGLELATSGPCKAEEEDVTQDLVFGNVPPCPGEAAVSSQPVNIKAEDSDVASPSPQLATSGRRRAKKKDVAQKPLLGNVPACPGGAAVSSQPASIKAENSGVATPGPELATSGPCKVEEEDVTQVLVLGNVPPCPGEAAVSSQPMNIKAEDSDVASPSPQLATSGRLRARKKDAAQKPLLGNVPPCPGEAAVSSQPVNIKAEDSGVASPSPQLATSGRRRAKKKDVAQKPLLGNVPPCPGEAAVSSQPVNIKVDDSDVASPSPQLATSGRLRAKKRDVAQKPLLGNVPPCPGEAAVSSQPVNIKAEDSGVASPSPQLATSGRRKAKKKDVAQKPLLGNVPPCPGGAAVSSQPASIKAEDSGVATPGPELATSGPCKAEEEDVTQDLVLGNAPPCPREAAVSSQPVNIKAEDSDVASPSSQLATSGRRRAKKKDVAQKLLLGNVPPCPGGAAVRSQPASIKAEDSGVASPGPELATSGPCKAEEEDVTQELVLGNVPPCLGGAAVRSQPASIKAEDSGVASPGPELATSGPCKAEEEDVTQELVLGNVPPCLGEAAVSSQPVSIKAEKEDAVAPELVLDSSPPGQGNPEQASKQRVWICGHSLVLSAEKQASSAGAGAQLDLEESVHLEWHGQEGMTWADLVPMLRNLAVEGQAPDVLVVHLGELDLEFSHGFLLRCAIRKELGLVKELFPQVQIMWSNMLLRRCGAGKAGSRTVNRARTMMNREMGRLIVSLGGSVIKHPAVLHTDADFYVDGDNLSCRGLCVFLQDIRNGILAHLHS